MGLVEIELKLRMVCLDCLILSNRDIRCFFCFVFRSIFLLFILSIPLNRAHSTEPSVENVIILQIIVNHFLEKYECQKLSYVIQILQIIVNL